MSERISNDPVVDAGNEIAMHLTKIAKLFKPGVKLTLLIRSPDNAGRNAYLSDEDDIEPVIDALRQLHANPRGGRFMV